MAAVPSPCISGGPDTRAHTSSTKWTYWAIKGGIKLGGRDMGGNGVGGETGGICGHISLYTGMKFSQTKRPSAGHDGT